MSSCSAVSRPTWYVRDMHHASSARCVIPKIGDGAIVHARDKGGFQAFVENLLGEMRKAPVCSNQVLGVLPCVNPDDGLWLEFGVFRGNTIRQTANYRNASNRWKDNECCVHGFDSFTGLPETWRPDGLDARGGRRPGATWRRGQFSLGGHFPFPENGIVKWHKGWFNESLAEFLHTRPEREHVSFLHVDSDLYSSAKTIFGELGRRLRPGTVIIFDELFGYPQYKDHEILALYEFLRERRNLAVEVLATSSKVIDFNPRYEYVNQACAVRLVRSIA